MANPKLEALRRTLMSNSRAQSFRGAAAEWHLDGLPPTLARFVSCEACGTPVRKTARIRNMATGTTLVVGLTCYDHIAQLALNLQPHTRLVTRAQFVKDRRTWFRNAFQAQYVDYIEGVGLHTWRRWLTESSRLDDAVPRAVLVGLAEMELHGDIMSDVAFKACVTYHDEKRIYPSTLLLPNGWRQWAPKAPTLLTVAQARSILAAAGRDTRGRLIAKPVASNEEDLTLREKLKAFRDVLRTRGAHSREAGLEAHELATTAEIASRLEWARLRRESGKVVQTLHEKDIVWAPDQRFHVVVSNKGLSKEEIAAGLRQIRLVGPVMSSWGLGPRLLFSINALLDDRARQGQPVSSHDAFHFSDEEDEPTHGHSKSDRTRNATGRTARCSECGASYRSEGHPLCDKCIRAGFRKWGWG